MSFASNSRKRSFSGVEEITPNDVETSSRSFIPFGRISERVCRARPDVDVPVHIQHQSNGGRECDTVIQQNTRAINTYSQLSFSGNLSDVNIRNVYGSRTDSQLGLVSSVTASRQNPKSTPSKETLVYPMACLSRKDLPHPSTLRKRATSKRKSISSQWKREDGVRDHINNLHRKQTHRPVPSLDMLKSGSDSVSSSTSVGALATVPYEFWTATARKMEPTQASYHWNQTLESKTGDTIGSSADLFTDSLGTSFASQNLMTKEPSVHLVDQELTTHYENTLQSTHIQSTRSLPKLSTHFQNSMPHTNSSAHNHSSAPHSVLSAPIQNSTPHSAISAHIQNSAPYSDLSACILNSTLQSASSADVRNLGSYSSTRVDNSGFPPASSPYDEPLLRHPSLDYQTYQYGYHYSYKERSVSIPAADRYKFSDTGTFRYTRRTSEE